MSSVKSISIMNPSDKHLVSLSSSALAENLLHTFTTKDVTPDADILDRWMQEIRFELRRRRRELSSSTEGRDDTTTFAPAASEEDDLLRAVREAALQQWHEQTSSSLPPLKDPKKSSSSSSSSVSLFLRQLNAGGGALASFVTWDRIQEQTAGDEQLQLKMLLEVQHLQDILPDWAKHIRPFLCRGLAAAAAAAAANHGHTDDYLKVHQEWFQKSRSSTEYRSLQIDLCENVLDSIQSDASVQQQQSKVSLTLNMFTDWMLRGLYVHDERVRKIGCTLWTLMANNRDIGMMMIQADPDAMWFSAWNAHQSPDQCLQVIEQEEQTAESEKTILLPSALQGFSQTDDDIANTRYRHFWLSVIRSVLVTTRVARFPWDLLQQKDPHGFVLDLYLQECARQSSAGSSSDTKTLVYNDAIETLLCGCRTAVVKEVFQEMLNKVKDFSNANNGLLGNILTRVERT